MGKPPMARQSHTATLVGRKIYIYGGSTESAFLGDVAVLDMDGLTWQYPIINPDGAASPRFGHSATLVNEHQIWWVGSLAAIHM